MLRAIRSTRCFAVNKNKCLIVKAVHNPAFDDNILRRTVFGSAFEWDLLALCSHCEDCDTVLSEARALTRDHLFSNTR